MSEELVKKTALTDMIDLARPAGEDAEDRGTENIRPEDVLIPRIGIVQKTSKELEENHPRFIEGAKFLDLYNSVTRGLYGRGPVHFVVLRVDRPRGVQFRPLDEGGGILDPNVPLDDPRMAFGEVDPATGKATKPLATKFYDFLVLVLTGLDLADPGANLAAFSFKSTGIKAAKQLNMLIMQRGPKALYKGVYEVSVAQDSNASGAFGVYKIKNAGWLKPDSAVEKLAAEMFQAWKHVETKIDREDTPEDPDGFDPARYEAEAAAAAAGGKAPVDPGM
jgi:hypothetical protein